MLDSNFDHLRKQAETSLAYVESCVTAVNNDISDTVRLRDGEQEIAKLRGLISKMKQEHKSDSWVVGKLLADCGRLEAALNNAKKNRLLVNNNNNNAGGTTTDIEEQRRNITSEEESIRTRLLNNDKILEESNESVRKTQALLLESRDIGVGTLDALYEQRDDLLQSSENMAESKHTTTKARIMLKRMATRALYNRIFLICVIVALLLADVLFLYFGFIKK